MIDKLESFFSINMHNVSTSDRIMIQIHLEMLKELRLLREKLSEEAPLGPLGRPLTGTGGA